jgi:hypothetical protein
LKRFVGALLTLYAAYAIGLVVLSYYTHVLG